MTKQQKAKEILQLFKKEYLKTGPFIQWSTPLELLIGIILSAQCTDERVNKVTKDLFKKYKTAQDYADADIAEVIIYNKALDNCDIESIEQYLSQKWGITVSGGKC